MTSGAEVGTVTELWRFPVKSLQGERVTHLDLRPSGAVGDRAWGIIDEATGRLLSAKTVPELLMARATTGEGRVEMVLPDGTTLHTGDLPRCHRELSSWLGREVRLAPAGSRERSHYDMTFDPPNDAAEPVRIETPAGSFFDLAGVHLLTSASLASVASSYPTGKWRVRRFRPNIFVDTGDETGFPEDYWVGHPLRVGPVTLDVVMRTLRCAMPLRSQPRLGGDRALDRDVGIYRTMAKLHDNHLGAYAEVATPGTVAVGAPVVA